MDRRGRWVVVSDTVVYTSSATQPAEMARSTQPATDTRFGVGGLEREDFTDASGEVAAGAAGSGAGSGVGMVGSFEGLHAVTYDGSSMRRVGAGYVWCGEIRCVR